MMTRLRLMALWAFLLAFPTFLGCSKESQETTGPTTPARNATVKQRGGRLLGFGVTEGSIGYEKAFGVAKEAGIQFLELPQQWDEIEKAQSVYESPFLAMANEVYPALKTSLVLSVNPIDTTRVRLPARFVGQPFDDPRLIAGFNEFVDFVLDALPDTAIAAISIGNEVDGWLADDPEKWAQYARFFAAVRSHIKKSRPGVPIGVKTTWGAVVSPTPSRVQAVNAHADAVMVTYYPLDQAFRVRPPSDVLGDMKRLVEVADNKPVFLLETGCPSGLANGSSAQRQAEFVDAMFSAWDRYADEIPMINFVWLHDMSRPQVEAMAAYYELKTPAFTSFLASLGLRTNDGRNKLAFDHLRKCLRDRAWE